MPAIISAGSGWWRIKGASPTGRGGSRLGKGDGSAALNGAAVRHLIGSCRAAQIYAKLSSRQALLSVNTAETCFITGHYCRRSLLTLLTPQPLFFFFLFSNSSQHPFECKEMMEYFHWSIFRFSVLGVMETQLPALKRRSFIITSRCLQLEGAAHVTQL